MLSLSKHLYRFVGLIIQNQLLIFKKQ